MVHPVIVGAIAGVIRAILGWHRSKEKFELYKFLRTLSISSIIGAIIGWFFPIQDPRVIFAVVFTGTVSIEELIRGYLKSDVIYEVKKNAKKKKKNRNK